MAYAKSDISKLQREVQLLRSFVIGVSGKDDEGNYRPKFVKRILAALSEKPTYEFKDETSLLKLLKQKRSK